MRRLSLISLGVSGLAFATLAGCGHSAPTGIVAPDKPLGQAEQSLLKQIEDTPAQNRQSFMIKHRMEVMQFASKNRAFGERLNRILGVRPGDGK